MFIYPSGNYFVWEVGRARCQCNNCPCCSLEIYSSVDTFFQWTNDVADRLAFSEVTSLSFLFSLLYQSLWNLIEHFCKAGAVKRHSFLCSNERDLPASRGGCKWHPQLREVFTRLFHQHIEEIEGYQGAIQANWYILLTRWISLNLWKIIYRSCLKR